MGGDNNEICNKLKAVLNNRVSPQHGQKRNTNSLGVYNRLVKNVLMKVVDVQIKIVARKLNVAEEDYMEKMRTCIKSNLDMVPLRAAAPFGTHLSEWQACVRSAKYSTVVELTSYALASKGVVYEFLLQSAEDEDGEDEDGDDAQMSQQNHEQSAHDEDGDEDQMSQQGMS